MEDKTQELHEELQKSNKLLKKIETSFKNNHLHIHRDLKKLQEIQKEEEFDK